MMNGQEFTMANEGCVLIARPDARGMWEIGYGRDIPPPPDPAAPPTCTPAQALQWFMDGDYPLACLHARNAVGGTAWDGLGTVRQAAVIDMAYELGYGGLLAFDKMLAALRLSQWITAGRECRASQYHREVPARSERVASMLETGAWPS